MMYKPGAEPFLASYLAQLLYNKNIVSDTSKWCFYKADLCSYPKLISVFGGKFPVQQGLTGNVDLA